MRGSRMAAEALLCLFVLNLACLPCSQAAHASNAPVMLQSAGSRSALAGPSRLGTFTHRVVDGRAVCLEAGIDQAHNIKDRDTAIPLIILTPASDPSRSQRRGLRIILRGTSQLQNSPAAIEAFKRAAAWWELAVETPMTIVIDVDFGPTLVGTQADDTAAAPADAQVLGGNALYPAVRAQLVSGPYSPGQKALFALLPPKAIPTDKGESAGLVASSATLRAIDLINPIADPGEEFGDFGPPPAIGFNSKFKFDFDPNDGIDQDKLDFEAIALHEIGHVLGFISFVGQQEMNGSLEVEPSIWDLFRVRPDAVNNTFSTAQRIVSSGGEQRFYDGGTPLGLSTGRPDGTGGDGREASHWKDYSLSSVYLGVMGPALRTGERQFLTDDDVAVLDAIGYRTKSLFDPTTVVPLSSGVPERGGMFAPPPGLGVLSHTHYSIIVPPGATQLRMDLSGTQDIDLYARSDQPVFNNGHTAVVDYASQGPSGTESITVTPSSVRPLHAGLYYMAVANLGPGDTEFTITATVTGGNISHAPAIFNIDADLEGDVLALDYTATDRDGDFVRAELTVLGQGELALMPPAVFAINSGNSTHIGGQLTISGLSALPTAHLVRTVLIDRAGNRGTEVMVDLGKGESGGITITSASFTSPKLTLKVSGPSADVEVEINGHVVAPPRKIKSNGSGSKLTIKGDAGQLMLQPGANRIRAKNVNGWSNILILNI